MEVQIVSISSDPIAQISLAAGLCYGKDDVSLKRIRSCYGVGHTSILEHAQVQFKISGISRACSHQLVRHRLMSFCQESQRYIKYNFSGDDWYVVPPEIKGAKDFEDDFREHMRTCAREYKAALEAGFKPEDARFYLPEATKTNLMVTTNFRELFHFFDLRLGKNAQWEVRELAVKMHDCVNEYEPDLIQMYDDNRENTKVK